MTTTKKGFLGLTFISVLFGAIPAFADVSVNLGVSDICDIRRPINNAKAVIVAPTSPSCPTAYTLGPIVFTDFGQESSCSRKFPSSETSYTLPGINACPTSASEIEALVTTQVAQLRNICGTHDFGSKEGWKLKAGTHLSVDSAICEVLPPPITDPVNAKDDTFNIEAGSGPIIFDVLANDIGNAIEIVNATPSGNGGTVLVVERNSIQYTPPTPLPDNFTDTFTYTIGRFLDVEQKAESTDTFTATVTVRGPGAPPPPEIKARNDKFQIKAQSGRAILNVLTNDTPASEVHIVFAGGNTRGGVSVINNGANIAYDPPRNLVGTIVENFNYNIVNNENDSLRSRASVKLTVVGTGRNTFPTNPAAPLAKVPTSSIGKIKSDLPVARAVENICDLLTFRAGHQATQGSLSDAQRDLQTCTCAIVHEGDVGAQRNAINQLSGGQHQFSSTVLRFAKGSASVILRRMAQLRKQVASNLSSSVSSLTSDELSEQLASELRGHYSSRAHLDDEPGDHATIALDRDPRSNILLNTQESLRNTAPNIHAESIFDSITLGRSSVYFSAPLGGSAGDDGLFSDQVGVFSSITTGSGDKEGQFDYDFSSYDITTGIDYTRPGTDRTRIYGGALSIGKVDTDARNGGNTSSDSIGITLYSSIFKADGWFADTTLSYSKSDIDIDRVVSFTASGKTVFQTSSGDTEGDELSLSVGGGKEINLGANNIRANIRLRYIDGSIDGLTETIGIPGAAGAGLALQTDDFDITSFRSELGIQFNRAIGTNFGVVIPYIGVNWIHEFEDRGSDIRARFVADAYSDGFNQLEESAPGGANRPTLFLIPGSENDSDYAQISLGSSFTFKGGKSAWLALTSLTGLSGISNEQVTAGFRWELGN